MKYCMDFGDTNFIGLVNCELYNSFLDEDWEFEQLLDHFVLEMNQNHILVFQMTNKGFEHSWNIEIKFGKQKLVKDYFRKFEGYIKVTNNELYLVDYDCLTMAAQFKDEYIPDKNCSRFKVKLENGTYRVNIYQFYNVDIDEYFGSDDIDILFEFIKGYNYKNQANSVIWQTY